MALEDAAVIGSLFSHLSHPAQIPTLLKAYECLRHTRTAKTQASSRMNQHIFHLPDGDQQTERDSLMREAMEEEMRARHAVAVPSMSPFNEHGRYPWGANGVNGYKKGKTDNEGNPNQWADRSKNFEQFSYDADEAATQWWREEGQALLRKVTPIS